MSQDSQPARHCRPLSIATVMLQCCHKPPKQIAAECQNKRHNSIATPRVPASLRPQNARRQIVAECKKLRNSAPQSLSNAERGQHARQALYAVERSLTTKKPAGCSCPACSLFNLHKPLGNMLGFSATSDIGSTPQSPTRDDVATVQPHHMCTMQPTQQHQPARCASQASLHVVPTTCRHLDSKVPCPASIHPCARGLVGACIAWPHSSGVTYLANSA